MSTSEPVMVYGAAGHTGRFVVDELLRRGLTPVLAGRSAARLADAARRHTGLEQRVVGWATRTCCDERSKGVHKLAERIGDGRPEFRTFAIPTLPNQTVTLPGWNRRPRRYLPRQGLWLTDTAVGMCLHA